MENDAYVENGYKDRTDYLNSLADSYGLDLGTVIIFAEMLGPNEDFDGLVSNVEDYAGMYD